MKNLFQWLKDKAGKMPVTLAQAAGLTAVVGAAGFAAMSYLNAPSDTNNTFIPPSLNNGEVVYVSQNTGGGFYESNGEVQSTFQAAPSRSIQLANQQELLAAQTRALEVASSDLSYAPAREGDSSEDSSKAYQLSGGDLGVGLGGGKNKQLGDTLASFGALQTQLSGVNEAVANAQMAAQDGGNVGGTGPRQAPKPGESASDQTAGQQASASRNWANNGLTRAGGGDSGSANTFVLQDSGKNRRNAEAASALEQANNALAQTQAAMGNIEGPRMRSQAHFGASSGLTDDKDLATHRSRRYMNAKKELEFIRKKSAALAQNPTNEANAGGSPFLASTVISGGIGVDTSSTVNTGGGDSSDISSTSDAQIGAIGNYLDENIEPMTEELDYARDDLKSWFLQVFLTSLAAMIAISILVKAAKCAPWPWNLVLYAVAGILTAAILIYIWVSAANKIPAYNDARGGSDGWSIFGWTLSGLLTGGVALAWIKGPSLVPLTMKGWVAGALVLTGLAGTGMGLSDLFDKGDEAPEVDTEEGDEGEHE